MVEIPILKNTRINPPKGGLIAQIKDLNTSVNIPVDSSNWIINLTLKSGENVNNLGGFGMHESAGASKDQFDEIIPPFF